MTVFFYIKLCNIIYKKILALGAASLCHSQVKAERSMLLTPALKPRIQTTAFC